jgi:hypothetical protein
VVLWLKVMKEAAQLVAADVAADVDADVDADVVLV